MTWVVAATASCALFYIAAAGRFVPVGRSPDVTYQFSPPGIAGIAAALIIIFAVLGLAQALVRATSDPGAREAARDARTGRWLAPLCSLGAVILGTLPALPSIGQRGAVVSYLLYDLRWWWLTLIVLWTVARADRPSALFVARAARAIATWTPAFRLFVVDAVVFTAVVAWAVATSPSLRWSRDLSGDEPKYVRYSEVWYQGGGFEISGKARMTELPIDTPPRVGRSLAMLPRVVGEETRAFATDLGEFVRNPRGFRWLRAAGADGFFEGKHGGIYEIYQPGISFLLFPGYLLDRALFGLDPGFQDEFPADLPLTMTTMLIVCGLCGVAVFRLLRNATHSEAVAMAMATLAMTTLPMTAFAFQLYPELPACLLIVTGVNFAVFQAPHSTTRHAFLAGLAAAALAWLHVRFGLISLTLLALALWRVPGRSRWPLLLGYAAILAPLSFALYRMTGSWLPTALWDTQSSGLEFALEGVLTNLVGYAVDYRWGLLPHSLLLFGVPAGLAVIFRQSRLSFLALVLMGAALGIPAAGHTLSAAGTTPGRLVLAVVPLFFWPIAVLVQRFHESSMARALVAIGTVLSLDAARAYNGSYAKQTPGWLRDMATSGWKPNLAFPSIRPDGGWASVNMTVLLLILAVVVAIMAAAFIRSRTPASSIRQMGLLQASLLALFLIAAVLTASTAANGRWTLPEYQASFTEIHE